MHGLRTYTGLAGLVVAATALIAPNLTPGTDANPPAGGAEEPAGGTLQALTGLITATPGRRVSEFILAQNPSDADHVAIAAIDWDDPAGSSGCAAYASRDGGRTWQGGIVPSLQNPHMGGDPWVAIDAAGRLHAICIEVEGDGETNAEIHYYYSRSPDDGATWSPRIRIPSPGGVDKGAIGIDHAGNLYVCYSGLSIHQSTDGGATWSERQLRPHGLVGNCNGIHAGPNGEVYVHWISLAGGELPFRGTGVIASLDQGETWSEPELGGVFWLERSDYENAAEPFRAPQGIFPALAVSPTNGNLFLTYQRVSDEDTFVVDLLRSTDRGATWQPLEVPLPSASSCTGCHVVHPGVAVDAQGRLALRWTLYLSPDDPIETWLIATADEGATWSEPLLLGASDPDTEAVNNPVALVPIVDPLGTAEAAPRIADWALSQQPNPSEAYGVAYAGVYSVVFPVGHGGGGDYWGMGAVQDGFLATWIAHYDTSRPQVWARIVAWH